VGVRRRGGPLSQHTLGRRVAVVGGAGFIGSHAVDRLLDAAEVEQVTVVDNFSSGRWWHLEHHLDDERLTVVESDVKELDALTRAMAGHDVVIHLASNPDIAAAMADPTIDFREGTLLTHHVAEAVRRNGVPRVVYASGSGVYGDLGEVPPDEDHGPLVPTSTYGASKLAGEALLCSYAHMFGSHVSAFRFGNVVGPRQTHGVGFDFLRRLADDPTRLVILGDGRQSKSYIHVDDVLDAVFRASAGQGVPFSAWNVATGDYITVSEIAQLAIQVAGLRSSDVRVEYTGGARGWKGDVPIVRLDTSKIRATGWTCRLPTREALRQSMLSMFGERERLGW
jgi:UDP-glucose 4-epimerase